jgi:hypothetical protein
VNLLAESSTVLNALLLVGIGTLGTLITLAVRWWRDRAKTAEQQHKLRWLLAEILDNLAQIEQYNLAAKVKLPTQAWETAKIDVLKLDQDIYKSMCAAYAEIWRFNGTVDLGNSPKENDKCVSVLTQQSRQVKAALSDSRHKLANYLSIYA